MSLSSEGQQIFRRERDDDALVWDFGRIDASQRDVVLALIARAMQLQQNRNDMLRTDGEDGRARELANSIAFAAAN